MWPPEWRVADRGAGEEGVLEAVELRRDLKPTLISIVANHFGDIREGIMILEDPAHLEALHRTLTENLGRPLKEIGDLETAPSSPLDKRGPRQVRPSGPPRYKSAAE
jgi:hypothetical protein